MKAGLVALLTGEPTINALVGSRVFIDKAPQAAALPYIVITQLASENNPSFDGKSNSLRFVDFDIDCKAERSVEADALATAVRVFLDDYSGPAGAETIGAVLMADESDEYEPPADGSDIGIFDVTLDVQIQYQPA